MKQLIPIFSLIPMMFLVISCGNKARLDPPPPLKVEPVQALRAEIDCGQINIAWKPCLLDSKANLLEKPADYLVFRRRGEIVRLEATPSSPIPTMTPTPTPAPSSSHDASAVSTTTGPEYDYKLIAIVSGVALEPNKADEPQNEMTFRDSGLPGIPFPPAERFKFPKDFPPEKKETDLDLIPGYSYFYRVQATGPGGILSEFSPVLDVKYVKISGPPVELSGQLTTNSIILKWKPPMKSCDKSELNPVGGYYIDRTEHSKPDAFTTIATLEKPDAEMFQDTQIKMDSEYIYRVRAFTLGSKTPGEISEFVHVNSEDHFAPAAPQNLRIAHSQAGILLNWDANPEPDTAGYRVYRSIASKEGFIPVSGDAILRESAFIDSAVQKATTYYYYVTAVDRSKAGNESAPSVQKQALLP